MQTPRKRDEKRGRARRERRLDAPAGAGRAAVAQGTGLAVTVPGLADKKEKIRSSSSEPVGSGTFFGE